MTAICIPKQMPRNGIFCSRAQRTAAIFPSVPRGPNPIGTRMASASRTLSGNPSCSIRSEST